MAASVQEQQPGQFQQRLFDAIPIGPLVFFRIGFGALMLWEVWRYFHYNRIARYYVEPSFFFHYFGFDWVTPLPGNGMFLLFHFVGLLSVLIMLGALYRISMALFWLCFTYIFLLDSAQYLNHFYLVSLISFLMIFIPAHRAFSVDALLRPALRTMTAPAWSLGVLRGQMAVVYFFGGVAKINPDWLAGEPMRAWMADRTDFPVIGGLFTEEWMVYLFSYGGLLLDLGIVPLLLWRHTRLPALLLATAFHLTNARLFNIGIFPWFAIAATLLFMPPHWFRLPWRSKPMHEDVLRAPVMPAHSRWIAAGIIVYFAVQIALPLRHWLYPGDPSWTEEGHTLAWHMRLRDKDGTIAFYASDPATGTMWPLEVETMLSPRQYDQMADNPPMLLRFVHHLAENMRGDHPDVHIYVRSMMSLNSRAPQLLIDPTANLVNEPDDLLASDWILPLTQRPVPHAPIPTLLISRRHEDVLLLVNVASEPFPLSQLWLEAGGERLSLSVEELQPDECLLLYGEAADLRTVFSPCNEAGARHLIPQPLDDLQVRMPEQSPQQCGTPYCLITAAPCPMSTQSGTRACWRITSA